jgi:hypothetical protein
MAYTQPIPPTQNKTLATSQKSLASIWQANLFTGDEWDVPQNYKYSLKQKSKTKQQQEFLIISIQSVEINHAMEDCTSNESTCMNIQSFKLIKAFVISENNKYTAA